MAGRVGAFIAARTRRMVGTGRNPEITPAKKLPIVAPRSQKFSRYDTARDLTSGATRLARNPHSTVARAPQVAPNNATPIATGRYVLETERLHLRCAAPAGSKPIRMGTDIEAPSRRHGRWCNARKLLSIATTSPWRRVSGGTLSDSYLERAYVVPQIGTVLPC